MNKAEITKFQKQFTEYQEYVTSKRLLRWNPKKRKYVIVIWKPRWFYAQKFRANYKKKYGVEYRSKKQKKQAWAKTRAKMNKNKP